MGDNGGMTCAAEVSGSGVEYVSGMKVWEGGMEYSCGMEVSGVVWNTRVVWKSRGWYESLISGTTRSTTTSLTS